MKLTAKQQKFIDLYIELGNASEAAKRAGYSLKTADRIGNENLKKPVVKAAIEERLKLLESTRIASAQEVMEHLTAALRGEISEEVVVVESTGDFCSKAKIVKKQLSAKERLKAAELLAKRFALLTPDTEINITPIIITGEDDLSE